MGFWWGMGLELKTPSRRNSTFFSSIWCLTWLILRYDECSWRRVSGLKPCAWCFYILSIGVLFLDCILQCHCKLADLNENATLCLTFCWLFYMNQYFNRKIYNKNINEAWFEHDVICCVHTLWESGKLPYEYMLHLVIYSLSLQVTSAQKPND